MSNAQAVVAFIARVMEWQDRVLAEVAVEVDGDWCIPSWVETGEGIPAHWLAKLLEFGEPRCVVSLDW